MDSANGNWLAAAGVALGCGEPWLIRVPASADANRNDLDGAVRIGIAIDALMFFMEGRGRIRSVPGDGEFVALAGVTDVGGAYEFGAAEFLVCHFFQALKFTLEVRAVEHAGRVIADMACQQHSQGGKSAGVLGDEHRSDSQLLSDFAGVQSAASSERD